MMKQKQMNASFLNEAAYTSRAHNDTILRGLTEN
jgi:hypothetical protein